METNTQVPSSETGHTVPRLEDQELLKRAQAAESMGLKLHPADRARKIAAELRDTNPELFGPDGKFAFFSQVADFIADTLQSTRLAGPDSPGIANLESPEITQAAGLMPAEPTPIQS